MNLYAKRHDILVLIWASYPGALSLCSCCYHHVRAPKAWLALYTCPHSFMAAIPEKKPNTSLEELLKERERWKGEPSWLIETELTYRKSLSRHWAECVSLLILFTDKIHRLPSYLSISLVSSLCFSLPHFNHTLPCPSREALCICQL